MDSERLKAELAAKRRPGAVVQRLGSFKQFASLLTGRGVPQPIRALVEEAFAAPEYSRPSVIAQTTGMLGEQLEDFSAADWSRTIATLLPQFAESARVACDALTRRPYQRGLARKPFRCPQSPQAVADMRARWLVHTTVLLGEYDADIRWVAQRAAPLAGWSGGADIGWLLAGAIDAGGATGREVYDILIAAATGDDEPGQMGRHVTQALMSSSRPEAWEVVEKLLLSAQRQEGLRQVILESVDESHPLAFRRMLRLILDEDLSRFSSTVRAADSWFGFLWDGASSVKIESLLERVLLFLENADSRAAALDERDAETVYLALWSIAFEDVDAAIAPASRLLASPSAEVRFVATHFLVQTVWTTALPPLVAMLGDADLRVAVRALDAVGTDCTTQVDGERLFRELEALMARVPKRSHALGAIVWPWHTRKLERPQIAAALAANVSAVPGDRLLPYIPDLEPHQRASFIRAAAGLAPRWATRDDDGSRRKLSRAERAVALDLLGDASADVRSAAFEALRTIPLHADEVDRLIDLLARKPGDLRNGALVRLRTLSDAELLAAADRLLADENDLRRLAGLELLRDAWESRRATAEVRSRVDQYGAEHSPISEQEAAHVGAVLGDRTETETTDDALGLVSRRSLRTWPEPRARRIDLDTRAARGSLESLATLVLTHRDTEIRLPSGEVKLLVESTPWVFEPKRDDLEAGKSSVPLEDVWRSWLRQRPDNLRDPDELELLRAFMAEDGEEPWQSGAVRDVVGIGQWGAGGRFLRGLCQWCAAWEPPARGADFLLDGLENALSGFTDTNYRELQEAGRTGLVVVGFPRANEIPAVAKLRKAQGWLREFRWWRELFPASVNPAAAERLYGLLRAFQARARTGSDPRATLADFLGAYHARAVGEDEFIDVLIGRGSETAHSSVLRDVTARKQPRALLDHPELQAIVDRCRRRVVEVETQRGDRETAASTLALELRCTGGLDTIARAVPALGKTHFARTFGWSGSSSRQVTLSHLVIRSIPRTDDTPEAFARWAREARIGQARLIELAVYAPQWAAHVNHVLQWPGLESGVWWIQAHTKDDRSWQLHEMKEIWAAEVSERTPLSAVDLTEGAVDVAWFNAAYSQLGPERWKALDTAAKYAASSAGHTRAQLFARAMAGLVTVDELRDRIERSRHQDSVRALGLVPLADGEAAQKDVLARYTRLQEFRRESRKFGSQRQQSEIRAVSIGMANLARTAAFRDPQRLQWAMEQKAVADLAHGPLVLQRGDVTLTLSIDGDGAVSLDIRKQEKALKALPAALKKDAEVTEIKARVQELKRQRSRVRDVLEEAMCRGDRFETAELRTLVQHPILAPALSRVVFIGDGVAGYLVEQGRALRDHAETVHVLGHGEEVRIAHPHDLLERGDWTQWQRECFRAERIQPFKQVFRELYPLTASERGTDRSRRYAGHQVNPRQALALLGGRGWVARPEEGVSRTFHDDGLTVRVGFQEPFFTPADIEGLTLEDVVFTRKGEWTLLPLDSVPARLVSEAMRDLDLVVSVAHRGGVDPEATASTVEMRAALVEETCSLLGLENVELKGHHVIIRGALAEYSIHLGSAGVMVLPGTAVPIVAVHSQHRGRLFLPFADDDPRTAEVLSKVLLLARDKEIRDPTILEWIRAARHGVVS
jgi:hypothetical protein